MTTKPDLPCPHPGKRRYATPEAAAQDARKGALIRGWFLRTYECPCGWWHLTSRRNPPTLLHGPTDQDGTAYSHDDLVKWIAALPEERHRELVANDARYQVAEPLGRALRDPRSLNRWLHSLKKTSAAAKQAARTAGRSARRDLNAYLELLSVRTAEAQLLDEARYPTAGHCATGSPLDVGRYAELALRRRRTAEAEAQAAARLRALHPEEWILLLDEARMGQQLPPVGEGQAA
jgi:hypothetical protein